MTALATAGGTLLAAGAAVGALWFTGQSLRATNAQLGDRPGPAVRGGFGDDLGHGHVHAEAVPDIGLDRRVLRGQLRVQARRPYQTRPRGIDEEHTRRA
ncbi:hypothetical protein [Nocardia gipuzkoensis]